MSALPPKADIRQRIEHVCFVPLTDIESDCPASAPLRQIVRIEEGRISGSS
jgi:hypothetical protein